MQHNPLPQDPYTCCPPPPEQCVSTLPLQSTQLTRNIFHIPKQVTFSENLYVTFCHIIYYNCNYMFTCYYLIVYFLITLNNAQRQRLCWNLFITVSQHLPQCLIQSRCSIMLSETWKSFDPPILLLGMHSKEICIQTITVITILLLHHR